MKRFEYNFIVKNIFNKWIETPSFYKPFPITYYLDGFKEATNKILTDGSLSYFELLKIEKGNKKITSIDWRIKIYLYILKRKLRK